MVVCLLAAVLLLGHVQGKQYSEKECLQAKPYAKESDKIPPLTLARARPEAAPVKPSDVNLLGTGKLESSNYKDVEQCEYVLEADVVQLENQLIETDLDYQENGRCV